MKLTAAARDALIVAACDSLVHTGDDCFWQRAPWHAHSATRCPKLNHATSSGRSLLRLGLLKTSTERGEAVLTEQGWTVFDQVATDAEKVILAEVREQTRRNDERDAINNRKRAWEQEHEETIREFRQRSGERGNERFRIDIRLREIAYEIGGGANDLDGLAAEARTLVARLAVLKAEQEADDAVVPKWKDG